MLQPVKLCTICSEETREGLIMDEIFIPSCPDCRKILIYQLDKAFYEINRQEDGLIKKAYN